MIFNLKAEKDYEGHMLHLLSLPTKEIGKRNKTYINSKYTRTCSCTQTKKRKGVFMISLSCICFLLSLRCITFSLFRQSFSYFLLNLFQSDNKNSSDDRKSRLAVTLQPWTMQTQKNKKKTWTRELNVQCISSTERCF